MSDDGIRLSVKVGRDETGRLPGEVGGRLHRYASYQRFVHFLSGERRIVIPQPVFAWPLVTSQVLIFGTTAFALVAAPSHTAAGDRSVRIMASLWRVLALVVLVMSPLRLLSVGAGMADSTLREVIPMMPQIMRQTFAGRVWTWRLATALLLALVAWISAPGRFATALILRRIGGAARFAEHHEPRYRQGRSRSQQLIFCIRLPRACGSARWYLC